MNKENLDSLQNEIESRDIYNTLCTSQSMHHKCFKQQFDRFHQCLYNALEVLLTDMFMLITGSVAEGTNITSEDYDKPVHSTTPSYISDVDMMYVWCYMQVIDEGDTLPERFDNHIYCRAERGEHTTDGFRKLRIIHRPEYYSPREKNCTDIINMSVEKGYISSSSFLATAVSASMNTPAIQSFKTGLGTKGPAEIIDRGGSAQDLVICFHVKTWPKEAESWFTRETPWPDRILKSKIRKKGILLVPIGNSNSQERDLEWRCSFSIAEKILFQSMTKCQRYTFITLKVLLKEYVPLDINTDGKKQLLSSYHIKTLFLWCLENSNLKWEPGHIVDIIVHLLDVLSEWIDQQYFPHYFIPSVNLLNIRGLHRRGNSLICFISAIRNDVSNKIKQSQFFLSQKSYQFLDRWLFCINIQDCVMQSFIGIMQNAMHWEVFINLIKFMYTLRKLNISHSVLIEGLISIQHDIDPQVQYLYRAMYSDPIHDKLLTKVVPGLIDQYRGCMHQAKYCMAARDGCVLPDVLHTAESILKNTLHLDPCSGHIKLACVYIATEDYVQAIATLHIAENKFLLIHKNMVTSALSNRQLNGIEAEEVIFHEVFQKWVEGQVSSDFVVTWLEYINVPDLLQFELIHESAQQSIDLLSKGYDESTKIVGSDCFLKWPPLSMIKLLKFFGTFKLGQSSTTHLENLVAELIASSMFVGVFEKVYDIYTVFNMAAWCYVKIKKYKASNRMITVSIGTSSQTDVMKRSAFSHHFLAYVIAQCLL